jgi:hypothetical protein
VRRREDIGQVPAALVTFTASDWPGDDQAAFVAWLEGREAWHAEHGWPGGWDAAELCAAIQTPDEPWSP